MNKDKAQKLASACRTLAMSLEDGTGPTLGTGWAFNLDNLPCCTFGHALVRAGFATNKPILSSTAAAHEFLDIIDNTNVETSLGILERINDSSSPGRRSINVVGPLQELAAALDEASKCQS